MRMMLKLRVPVTSGNRGIKDGTLAKVIQQVSERIRPECQYFGLENGTRTMWAVFDLKNTADMVPSLEPAMLGLDCEVELSPVMTGEDLATGMKALG